MPSILGDRRQPDRPGEWDYFIDPKSKIAYVRLVNFSAKTGPDLVKPMVGRGCAYADIDGDGDLDVLLMENDGQPRLLRNDGAKNGWLRIRTASTLQGELVPGVWHPAMKRRAARPLAIR